MACGESLHPHQLALAAQDREDLYQQHPPLREVATAANWALWQSPEKSDLSACSSRLSCGLGRPGAGVDPAYNTVGPMSKSTLPGQICNRIWWQKVLLNP